MKHLQNIILAVSLIAMVASCAPVMQPPLKALDGTSSRTLGEKYAPRIDNFQIILDASLSMDEGGKNDFIGAREIVRRINQGIPIDLSYNGGLRSIGHNSHQSNNPTDLLYGMTNHQQKGFHDGLGEIRYVGGSSPMAAALLAAGSDLHGVSGSSALIVVSDGLDMDNAPAAAKKIKGMLGDKLCIYTIAIGKERNGSGQDLLQLIADAGQCGSATIASALADDAKMMAFVDAVFLTTPAPKPAPLDSDGDGVNNDLDQCLGTPRGAPVNRVGCPLDSDGDGVYDYQDQCPGTPSGASVDRVGCPLDTDGDGVYDYMDQCPDTPNGAPVDRVGCPLDSDGDGVPDYLDRCPDTPRGISVDTRGCPTKLTLRINFSPDSNVIGERYAGEISKAAKCVNEYSGNLVYIEGHTDSQGAAEYNQALSERRASSVVKALIDNHSIPGSRLIARGYGEAEPVADNATKAGRLQNRRVEVACGAAE